MYQNFFFLKRHKRLAHDEISCKHCELKFSGSNAMTRHFRTEHLTGNEHICELCGMGFKVKTYLKRHCRQQHPERVKSPFVCIHCDKPFGTGKPLKNAWTSTNLANDQSLTAPRIIGKPQLGMVMWQSRLQKTGNSSWNYRVGNLKVKHAMQNQKGSHSSESLSS